MELFKYFLLFIFFISFSFGATAKNPASLEKVSVQLLWLNQFEFAGFYIAKEKGFYKDAGLDVEIREFKFGTSVVEDVVSGKADFGVGRSSLIVDRINREPVVALSAIFQSSPLVLLTQEASNIRSARELIGKKIMVSNDEVGEVSISSMLLREGIRDSDVQFIPHTFNIEDLISGKTDAMTAYVSNQPYQLKEKGIVGTTIDPKDYGFDFYS
ncbi:MAG: ABC transporter substrate-binding protein, partial [Campylobacterales bacterium]|nr:ABC transporter substrate-binding protein [Campylobacterales bacterium]